jgi:DNA-directed RNA polymerase specialized sigma24 family protein
VLLRLARERLTDRERQVFFGIHFEGLTRATLAADLGLTSQAVGQMYVRVLRYLYNAARDDPTFPTTNAPTTNAPTPPTKGGPRDR